MKKSVGENYTDLEKWGEGVKLITLCGRCECSKKGFVFISFDTILDMRIDT